MGWFRFHRSVRLGKGSRLNMSKTGLSVSTKADPITWNSRGRRTVHLAKGLSYQSTTQKAKAASPRPTKLTSPPTPPFAAPTAPPISGAGDLPQSSVPLAAPQSSDMYPPRPPARQKRPHG